MGTEGLVKGDKDRREEALEKLNSISAPLAKFNAGDLIGHLKSAILNKNGEWEISFYVSGRSSLEIARLSDAGGRSLLLGIHLYDLTEEMEVAS
jgi:hypothetical protein